MIGKAIGRYRILEKLGEGGMGEVYLAEDTELHRNVALKFMSEELSSDPDFIARFKREARAAAGLNHPNIVTVHEVGEHEGRPFIAMSYIDGEPLGDVIAAGLEPRRATEIVAQICDGLQSAHAAGIVHRDIKPDNIYIDKEGRVKILDFGLAKLKGVSKNSGDQSTLGTIFYMSPEQAQGGEIDQRPDLFSVGAVLYEMLTGRSPFKREHAAAIMYSIINEEPIPPSELNPQISAELEEIVLHALKKDPEHRYQNASEFAEELRHAFSRRVGAPLPHANKNLFRILLPTSVVFVAILLFVTLKPFNVEFEPDRPAVAADNSLAVMYFENLVDRDDPQRLGEIVTNLLITDLSESEYMEVVSSQRLYDLLKREGMEGEKVIDRSSATQVATNAKAKWMLLGSILQEEPNYILTSQVVDVESGKVVGSQRVVGQPGDGIFALVDKLTAEVKSDLTLPAAARREHDSRIADVTTHSTEAYRHYLEGLDMVNKYYFEEARVAFEKALESDSTMAMAHLAMASPGVMTPKNERQLHINKAMEYSDKVSGKDLFYIRSMNAQLNDDIEAARKELEGLIAEYPNEKGAYKRLADICRMYDDSPEKAIEYYRKVIEIDPQDKPSYNVLAYLYQDLDDIDNYIWAIYQYMSLAPNEANPYDTRGDLYAFSGKIDKAIDSYAKALDRKPDFYASRIKSGDMYLFKREYEDSKYHFSKLLASSDEDYRSEGRFSLALIPQFQGKFQDALRMLEQGMEADVAEGYKGYSYPRKFGERAEIYASLGQFETAWVELEKALEIHHEMYPEDSTSWRSFQVLLQVQLGRFDDAEKNVEFLLAHADSQKTYGMYKYHIANGWLQMGKGNLDAACTEFEKAAGNSKEFHARFPLALAYLKAGRLGDSAREFENILRRYSKGRATSPVWAVRVHYYLATAYEESGRHDRAIEQYEEFLGYWGDADANVSEVPEARDRLAKLRIQS